MGFDYEWVRRLQFCIHLTDKSHNQCSGTLRIFLKSVVKLLLKMLKPAFWHNRIMTSGMTESESEISFGELTVEALLHQMGNFIIYQH